MMNTGLNRGSAKIYQFPTNGRIAGDVTRREATKLAADISSPRAIEAALGSGWYHEAAIEEAQRAKSVIKSVVVPMTFPRQ